MTTELFIESLPVDINAALSSLLTFAIDDVKDFATRQTTFSKTITIPGTNRNNALLGNIFETGHSNAFNGLLDNIGYNFNASKSARCLLFQDNLQTFKGTMRLLQINKDRGNIEYEVALNGELTTLNVKLSSGFLTDLDFSAYDTRYLENNIIDSWDNPGGSGLYFPLVDYGTYGRAGGSAGKHDWDFKTFRPALYVKEYIDKMFEVAGFRYDCALFNTPRFEHLIVPHNQKKLTSLQQFTLDIAAAGAGSDFDETDGTSKAMALPIHTIVQDFTFNAGSTEYTYTGAAFTGQCNFRAKGQQKKNSGAPFTLEWQKNGVTFYSIDWESSASAVYLPFDLTFNFTIGLLPGDIIRLVARQLVATSFSLQLSTGLCRFTIAANNLTAVESQYNDLIIVNEAIPKNIRQIDFLSSIIKLFNLYVYEDKFDDRLINISPYVDFYSEDSGNAVDWTYKLNRDQAIKIKPMSELNSKTYNFKYKDDSDFYNDLYKKRYNQGYGSYIFESDFEFTSAVSNLELIFASTPLVGYGGEDKIYPTIFKRTGPDTAPVEENIDSVIRIMQTKKITGVSSWDILNGVTVLDSVTDYGYAGHLDDPDAPSNDLNFGVLKELFFALVTGDLTVTQFNVYWSSYMAEICDKDSKMLIAKFYLNPKDIFDLDFSKYVYESGVLYRLNKITDYNTTIPNDCEVQLLKVINTIY